jgi:glycolate oxidase iron-sulfur subunit
MTDLAPTTPRFLADVYDAASECNKCSLCQAVCPTYVVNPVEWETARGRVALIRDAIEGRIELRDIADGPLSTCLTCNNCVAACAPRVPTAHIVSRARQELFDETGPPWGQSLLLRRLLPSARALRRLHRVSRALQGVGLERAGRRFGLHRLFGAAGDMAEISGPLPARSGRDLVAELPSVATPVRGRVALLTCCYQNLVAPEATLATARVLQANGWETAVPELGCFGLPAKTLGDRDAMIDMAARTVSALRDLDVDHYVGDSASCVAHLQSYGEILGEDRTLGGEARRIAGSAELVDTFLARTGLRAEMAPLRWRVAVDLPCSLPIDGPERAVPSQLLDLVPGLTQVPLHEAAMCCGGPGNYAAQQPERSAAILDRKMANVRDSGAEVLVTENVSCVLQLRNGTAQAAPDVRVLHLMELLDESIQTAARRKAAVGV